MEKTKKELTVKAVLFKKSGKFYTDVKVTVSYHQSFFDFLEAFEEQLNTEELNYTKNYNCVCMFEEHKNGYPIMIPYSEE